MNLTRIVQIVFIIWFCFFIYIYRRSYSSCSPIKVIIPSNAPTSNTKEVLNERNFYPKFFLNAIEVNNIVRCRMNDVGHKRNWTNDIKNEINYSSFPNEEEDIYRAIIVHLDLTRIDYFLGEFKGFYRSWLEMQRYEPLNIHTDILVFANCSNAVEDLNDLNCREPSGIIPIKRRVNTQKKEQGNCYCINYLKLSSRPSVRSNGKWENEQLAKSIATVPGSIPNKAPFNLHPSNLHLLDKELISIDSKIPYVDLNLISRLIVDVKDIHEPLNSVNIAYEGYSQFRNYDFILKSDLDVFITPHFGTYLPPKVQMNKILKRSFVTGTGGYSNDWNNKKFKRMMNELGAPYIWFTQMRLKIQTPFNQTDLTRKYFLKPPSFYSGKIPTDNIGSTWYGSSNEMHLIGAIAMRSALYLHLEEFSPIERGGNLGIMMWPDWHYGVLSMYASHMAIIYLSCATLDDIQGTENVQNPYPLITPYYAPDMLDGGSAASNKLSDRPIDHPIIHIHCWHTELLFSKFQFKVSGYCLKEIMTLQSTNNISSHDLPSNIYSLRMACDSNNTEPNYLSTLFQNLSYLYEI